MLAEHPSALPAPAHRPIHPCRTDILRQIAVVEQAVTNLAAYDLRHPEVVAALAELGHNRALMRVLLAARLAHHRVAQERLTRALADDVAQTSPASAALQGAL